MTKRTKLTGLFILLLGWVAAIVYLWYQAQPKKQTFLDTTLPPIDVPLNPVARISFEFPTQSTLIIPSTLKIYSLDRNSLDGQQADNLAKDLNFKSKPKVINDPVYGTTYLWSEEKQALVVKLRDRLVHYTAYPELTTLRSGFTQSKNEILQSSPDFLQQLNKLISIKLSVSDVKFFKQDTDESKVATSSDQANLAELKLTATIDNLPIIGTSTFSSFPTISVDNKLNVLSAELALPPLNISTSENRPTLTLEELKSKIGEAKLIEFNNQANLDNSNDLFTGKVNIERIYLAYYQQSHQTTMQPVFVLEVTGKTTNNNTASGIFVMPALK